MVNTVVDIDKDMDKILTNPLLPPDKKAKLHGQLQQRYLHYQHQRIDDSPNTARPETLPHDEQPPDVKKEVDGIELHILSSAPKNQGKKVRLILDHFKDKGVIGWNTDGEIKIDNINVPGSNIVHIMNSLLVKRKEVPYGMDNVIGALQRTNFPITYISNNNIVSKIKSAKEMYLPNIPESAKKSISRKARKSLSGVWGTI